MSLGNQSIDPNFKLFILSLQLEQVQGLLYKLASKGEKGRGRERERDKRKNFG
jgi:hypothetical protein